MTIQVLRPLLHWLYVQADQPFEVPQDVLDLPGVKYTVPDTGYTLHRCEVPFTTWHVPAVRRWLEAFGAKPPDPPMRPSVIDEGAALFPHQREALEFLVTHPHAVLGDEMGLGKTRTALTAADVLCQVYRQTTTLPPVLIIAPKALRATWKRELEAALGYTDFVALEGMTPSMDALRGKRWIFCHYDILRAWWSFIYACRPLVGILDEAHLVKDARTQRGRATQLALSATPFRFVLTGTPILNRVSEFWSLLELATGKWTWGTPSQFRERYAGAYFDGHGLKDGPEVTNKEELRERLSTCYIRRTAEGVGLDLPPLTQQIIEADVAASGHSQYARAVLSAEREGITVEEMVNALLKRRASKAALDFMGRLRKITSEIKVKTTVAFVDSLLQQGESAVVFTWTREMAEKLCAKLEPWQGALPSSPIVRFVHGGMGGQQRQAVVDQFQLVGGVIIATIDALSVGVTLHKARHAVIHDLDPVPNKMLQALHRVKRIGQVWPTTGTFVIAPNTIDEIYARIFQRKGGLIADASGDEGPQTLASLIEPQEVYSGITRLLDWARRV